MIQALACCDLCDGDVYHAKETHPIEQQLLCRHCLADLSLFSMANMQGNLLNWPAINKALPQISFDRLVVAAPYQYPFTYWLKQFKYQGRFELAPFFSALLVHQWMVENNVTHPVDLVLSVPLHPKKWQVRGYNQAHLIAKFFAEKLQRPYQPSLVSRCKSSRSQVGKTGRERRKSLANAFVITEKIPKEIKHVILIDDVVTTGSTASEITKQLKKSGVQTVTLLTVCLSLPNA